jgi:cytochrome c553
LKDAIRTAAGVLLAGSIATVATSAVAQTRDTGVALSASARRAPPAWAYPVNPPEFKPAPDDGSTRRVPDSSAGFTLGQLRDLFSAPDWHPGDHPPLPEVVARGRKPDVFACGFCHRADGPGGPENASLAGLPAIYIVQQMADFASGARAGAGAQLMKEPVARLSMEDIVSIAAYLATRAP